LNGLLPSGVLKINIYTRSLARLGQAISMARRRRHFSQLDLAERIGASVTTIRRMETGHPGTALVHLVRTMQVFGELAQLDQLLDTPQDPIAVVVAPTLF
jgi:transcriptional regulator with XRE-family HTH domain